MQTLHAGQVTPPDLPCSPMDQLGGEDTGNTYTKPPTSSSGGPGSPPPSLWPPKSHMIHETEAVARPSLTPSVSHRDAQSSCLGSMQGEQIFLLLLIHLLLLPAVICILEVTALNIVVKILTPKTKNLMLCCHKWYS